MAVISRSLLGGQPPEGSIVSLTAAVAANVILDLVILSVLAWVMSRPARLEPHGRILRGLELSAPSMIEPTDGPDAGQSVALEREAA